MDAKLFATLRKLNGLSQRQFAEILNISHSMVAKIETEERTLPDRIAKSVASLYPSDQVDAVKTLLDRGKWR